MTWAADRGEGGPPQWLAGNDTSGARVRAFDWSATPLGAIERWPQSLRTALSLCLRSPAPACLAWGPTRTQLFNEPYRAFCSTRFPSELGQDFAACWRELWSVIGAPFEQALAGESALVDIPPASVALSLIPVRDERDAVGGVLLSVLDTPCRGELARAEQDLEALRYAISHDLHAPLRTLQEMARILVAEHSQDLPGDADLFLQHFVQGTAKLDQRIEGLARFGKLSCCAMSRRRVDVADIVERLLAERAADTQRVAVVVGELPEALGDPDLIRQVFAALLSNAFKFTRDAQNPRIEVGAHREATQNAYFVADNGAGFDMKYAARLFGLFQRLHSEAQFAGAGVELALARRIVERHGGTMQAEADKDRGATFHFTLPA
jgi:signal transduction histidine kinase